MFLLQEHTVFSLFMLVIYLIPKIRFLKRKVAISILVWVGRLLFGSGLGTESKAYSSEVPLVKKGILYIFFPWFKSSSECIFIGGWIFTQILTTVQLARAALLSWWDDMSWKRRALQLERLLASRRQHTLLIISFHCWMHSTFENLLVTNAKVQNDLLEAKVTYLGTFFLWYCHKTVVLNLRTFLF